MILESLGKRSLSGHQNTQSWLDQEFHHPQDLAYWRVSLTLRFASFRNMVCLFEGARIDCSCAIDQSKGCEEILPWHGKYPCPWLAVRWLMSEDLPEFATATRSTSALQKVMVAGWLDMKTCFGCGRCPMHACNFWSYKAGEWLDWKHHIRLEIMTLGTSQRHRSTMSIPRDHDVIWSVIVSAGIWLLVSCTSWAYLELTADCKRQVKNEATR